MAAISSSTLSEDTSSLPDTTPTQFTSCDSSMEYRLPQRSPISISYPSPSSSVTSRDSSPLVSTSSSKPVGRVSSRNRTVTSTAPGRRSPSHIPRPRNPFMIYRSEFYAQKKITLGIEHDHRHISRIIAYCWNNLSKLEKQPWYDKAAEEKARHAQKYPDYQYAPVHRTKPAKKRNVRRNGAKDLKRCETLALLLGQGKEGDELESAIRQFDVGAQDDNCVEDGYTTIVFDSKPHSHHSSSPISSLEPPSPQLAFRSPLLPPVPELPSLQNLSESHSGPSHSSSAITHCRDALDMTLVPSEAFVQAFPCDPLSSLPHFATAGPDWTTSFSLPSMTLDYPAPLTSSACGDYALPLNVPTQGFTLDSTCLPPLPDLQQDLTTYTLPFTQMTSGQCHAGFNTASAAHAQAVYGYPPPLNLTPFNFAESRHQWVDLHRDPSEFSLLPALSTERSALLAQVDRDASNNVNFPCCIHYHAASSDLALNVL